MIPRIPVTPPRNGATLVEVLMSLLIMSIGIVSVFSLFPIGILSSIRASQLTNSKLLEQNVVDTIRCFPQIIECAPRWQPNIAYGGYASDPPTTNSNQRVVPTPSSGTLFSPTNLYFDCSVSGGGTSGYREPVWTKISGQTNQDGPSMSAWTWTASRSPGFRDYPPDATKGAAYRRSVYVVDPLGYWYSDDSSSVTSLATNAVRTRFGSNSDGTAAYQNSISNAWALPRNHAGFTKDQAATLFSLPDSWSVAASGVPLTVSSGAVQFDTTVDLSSLSTSQIPRLTLQSVDGKYAVTRNIDVASSTPTTATLVSGQAIPTVFQTSYGNARIEVFSRRYTYFLTVIRNPDGTADVSCPIMFNRSFSAMDERAFDATATAGSDTITVDVSTASPMPLISEGNFIFDSINGHWYRIVSYGQSSILAGGVDIVLDRTPDVIGNLGIVFMPGIIRVYKFSL